MLSKGQAYFPFWLAEMKLCNLFCSIPYTWEDRSERIVLIGRAARAIYPTTLLLHGLYLGAMGLHMYLHYEVMTLPNCLKGLVVIGAYSTCFVPRATFWIWEKEGLDMLNSFLHFEKNLIKEYPKMDPKMRRGELYTKLVFVLGTGTTALFGIFIGILLLMEPCTPPYMLSMTEACLSGREEELKMAGISATRMIVLILDGLMAYFVFQPAAFGLGNVMLGYGISLKKYLLVLQEEVDKIRENTNMKRDQVEAGLLCVFGYFSQIQLLVKQVNITLKDLFIPGTLLSCSNAMIFTLYVCIKLHDKIPMPGFSFFPMILTDALLIIGFDFAATSFVYSQSKEAREEWKKLDGFGRKSVVRAKFRGLPLLKIRFGMNFVDELTSLTILDFCINQTVSLLLMT